MYDSSLTETSFDVDEYVLPTYEVKVTSQPSYILSSATNATFQICAKYTYGKPVKGNVTVEVSYQSYGYWDYQKYPKVTNDMRIEGCVPFTVQEKDFGWITNYNYRSRALSVFAKVTEDGTNDERNGTMQIYLTRNPVNLRYLNEDYSHQYYKPGMPSAGKVSLTNPDDSPCPGANIQICVMCTTQNLTATHHRIDTYLSCKNMTSDEKGIARYTIPGFNGSIVNMKVQADAMDWPTQKYADSNDVMFYQPSNVQMLKPWYSASKRYIQIAPVTEDISCESVQNFMVYVNGKDGDVYPLYYQVMTRDGIVSQGSSSYEFSQIKADVPVDQTFVEKPEQLEDQAETETVLGIISLPIEATYSMAPTSTLLVYYVTDDGEIIADSIQYKVTQCFKNKVEIEFSSEQELPGANVSLKVTARSKSKCGIGVVDKSVTLLGSSTAITPEKVLNLLNGGVSYADGYFYPGTTCVSQATPGPSTFLRRRRRSVVTPPYLITSGYVDSIDAFQNVRMLYLTDLTMVTKPCTSDSGPFNPYPIEYYAYDKAGGTGYASTEFTLSADMAPMAAGMGMAGGMARNNFEDNSEPTVQVRDNFPETWLWEIEYTNDDGEVTVQRKLGDTITQWDATAVCMHPVYGLGASEMTNITTFKPFFISTYLPASMIRGEHTPVVITLFNYYNECMPVTLKLDPSNSFTILSELPEEEFCICGGESISREYLINATTLGPINVTARAFTIRKREICGDKEVGNTIASDGATNTLLVESEGFPHQVAVSNFFCPSQSNGTFKISYPLDLPADSVPDSARAECFVSGDLMGPALRHITNLINMPTGCGEQNMLSFVPDIFILDYLTNTGKLDEETNDTLKSYLKTGYERELTYRHGDGSYSAFGEEDSTGSIWLTAFVVKSYTAASRYIYVDSSHIASSVQWILIQQDTNTSCFPLIGEVHHTAMQGGSGSNLGSHATMTAYILISLLEAEPAKNTSSVKMGLQCLSAEKNPTTYTLALITYATCLANDSEADNRLEQLMSLMKVEGEGHYWEDDSTNSPSIQTEIAGYAIMSLLTRDETANSEKCLPIVRWLTSKRNPNGGFYSTQDTVIALQALAMYSKHTDKSKINIDVIMNEVDAEQKTFHVDENNKLLVQTTDLQKIPTTVSFEATGTGCALLQCNSFYNKKTPPDFQALHLNVTTVRGTQKSCKKASITSCMSYNYQNKWSSMTVMNLHMLSGYEPDMDSVNKLKQNSKLNFKRVDYTDNNMALYFSKVGPNKICFTFGIIQAFEIQNLQPSTVELFEYYQPEHQISQEYTLDSNCTIPATA